MAILKCFWCGTVISKRLRTATDDHVRPKALGGKDHYNIVPSCRPCNEGRAFILGFHLRCEALLDLAWMLSHNDKADLFKKWVRRYSFRLASMNVLECQRGWVLLERAKLGCSPSDFDLVLPEQLADECGCRKRRPQEFAKRFFVSDSHE